MNTVAASVVDIFVCLDAVAANDIRVHVVRLSVACSAGSGVPTWILRVHGLDAHAAFTSVLSFGKGGWGGGGGNDYHCQCEGREDGMHGGC